MKEEEQESNKVETKKILTGLHYPARFKLVECYHLHLRREEEEGREGLVGAVKVEK